MLLQTLWKAAIAKDCYYCFAAIFLLYNPRNLDGITHIKQIVETKMWRSYLDPCPKPRPKSITFPNKNWFLFSFSKTLHRYQVHAILISISGSLPLRIRFYPAIRGYLRVKTLKIWSVCALVISKVTQRWVKWQVASLEVTKMSKLENRIKF